jgi:hypothetical protein
LRIGLKTHLLPENDSAKVSEISRHPKTLQMRLPVSHQEVELRHTINEFGAGADKEQKKSKEYSSCRRPEAIKGSTEARPRLAQSRRGLGLVFIRFLCCLGGSQASCTNGGETLCRLPEDVEKCSECAEEPVSTRVGARPHGGRLKDILRSMPRTVVSGWVESFRVKQRRLKRRDIVPGPDKQHHWLQVRVVLPGFGNPARCARSCHFATLPDRLPTLYSRFVLNRQPTSVTVEP